MIKGKEDCVLRLKKAMNVDENFKLMKCWCKLDVSEVEMTMLCTTLLVEVYANDFIITRLITSH